MHASPIRGVDRTRHGTHIIFEAPLASEIEAMEFRLYGL